MPGHGPRSRLVLTAEDGRCDVASCLVCALDATAPRRVSVAEWLAERLVPAVRRARLRARRRRQERVARCRARERATGDGRWPYTSWWDEGLG